MRIPSGKTDQVIYFVARSSTDGSRLTGLSSFTVYRSRNGGSATAYTTPTIAELSSSNMPGVYSLAIDEDTTIASGSDSEEYAVHITATGMLPVSRTVELYRSPTGTGRAEPAQAAPPATASMGEKIDYLYAAWRNKSTSEDGWYKLFADDAATVIAKATQADDGTTFTRGEMATGP